MNEPIKAGQEGQEAGYLPQLYCVALVATGKEQPANSRQEPETYMMYIFFNHLIFKTLYHLKQFKLGKNRGN